MTRMTATATTTLQIRFRHNVAQIMDADGIKPSMLARRLGVAQPRINEMLSGDHKIGLYVVDQVAEALGVDPMRLLEEIS